MAALALAALVAATRVVKVVERGGFDWGDAAIGAGVVAGLVLVGTGLTASLRHRKEKT